jgi:phenylacetate-coenzyme A ligase PaaK-like adenylate-forming protein
MSCEFEDKVFKVDAEEFQKLSLDLFRFQVNHNPVYHEFVAALKINPDEINRIEDIPFLPIQFFKSHTIKTTEYEPAEWFESSGTTQTTNSKHYLKDKKIYRNSYLEGFRKFYGDPEDWVIIGLLPSYLERQHSSLVVMVDELIRLSGKKESGFYLYEHHQLSEILEQLEKDGRKTLLIGVSFGLLDFAEAYPVKLQHTILMETGGMKGRRKEMIRAELHDVLEKAFGLNNIHSEYGMTELLSQAYSKEKGLFETPPWMKIFLREEDDPLRVSAKEGSGLINVIDLANIYSCAFIATEDVGRIHRDGRFEVLGRADNSDIRGCSLLISPS